MNVKEANLNPVHLESIYKKIKDDTSPSMLKLYYDELEAARKQFEGQADQDIYDQATAKQLKKFFRVWNAKRKTFKRKLRQPTDAIDDEVDPPNSHRTGLLAREKQALVHDDWQTELKIEERDVIEEIKNEKLGVIKKLSMIKDLQLKESELHNMHTEKLQGIDQVLGDTLKTQQQTNKELQIAYMYSTKTTTSNMKTGMTATGGIFGTIGLPGIGTALGGLVGWTIGKKVENTVVNKTQQNFDKLNSEV